MKGKGKVVVEAKSAQPKTKMYTCDLCHKEYATQQRLAGHQNAHGRERMEAVKHLQEYGLGVRNESMIQKPSGQSSTFGHSEVMKNLQFLYTKQLLMEGSLAQKGGGGDGSVPNIAISTMGEDHKPVNDDSELDLTLKL